jgi:hypothetical protein
MSARLRGQRISRDELIRESRDVLKNAGVRHHSRALLLSWASAEVITSDNPAFRQLQPQVLKRDSTPWVRAYAIVSQFLKEHGLAITLATAATENGGALPEVFDAASSADSQLSGIIETAPPKRTIGQIVARTQTTPPRQRPALLDLPEINLRRDQSPSPRSILDYDALHIAKTATRTSPLPIRAEERPQPTKKKGIAPRKAGKGKTRTPKKEPKAGLIVISSPGKSPHRLPSDADLQSDFVIEEIRPPAHKK